MQVLYRFYNAAGDLLYVGITNNPTNRFTDHMVSKSWWSEVAQTRLEFHANRAEVEAAELRAIQTESPRYNIRGVVAVDWVPETWPADWMPDMCERCSEPEIYFPYKWRTGTGRYRCKNWHSWTCGWGHSGSGDDMRYMGKPIDLDTWDLPEEGKPMKHDPGTPCDYWVENRYCGAAPTRPYLQGCRCSDHTPARLAGRFEPDELKSRS